MTSMLAKYISKKILGETIANNFGQEDPYFETVPATRLNGTRSTTKTKKVRKAIPPGISEHDSRILTKVKRRAYHLDMSLFSCCGIRFGWGSVVGLVPAIGDALDAFMALMVMRTCQQIEGGLPADIKAKMMFNVIFDFAIGLVPLIGDVFDALYRANTRNAAVLEKYLRDKGAQALKAQGSPMPAVDPSDPDQYDAMMRAEHGPPPQYTTGHNGGQGSSYKVQDNQRQGVISVPTRAQAQTQPQIQAPIRSENSRSGSGGFFSGFGSKKIRKPDLEQGSANIATPARIDAPLPAEPENAYRNKSTLQKNRPA